MKNERGKTDGIAYGVNGFIVFNKVGDIWMGSHSEERLKKFIEQQPWLAMEMPIEKVSYSQDDVRITKPDHLKKRHKEAMMAAKKAARV